MLAASSMRSTVALSIIRAWHEESAATNAEGSVSPHPFTMLFVCKNTKKKHCNKRFSNFLENFCATSWNNFVNHGIIFLGFDNNFTKRGNHSATHHIYIYKHHTHTAKKPKSEFFPGYFAQNSPFAHKTTDFVQKILSNGQNTVPLHPLFKKKITHFDFYFYNFLWL